MSSTIHLAIPAGDIETALAFYRDVLGCSTGNAEPDRWIDVNFWGNELTLHQSEERAHYPYPRHVERMEGAPHFDEG